MHYYWPDDAYAGGSFVTYRLTLDGKGSESDWMILGTQIERDPDEEEPA